MTVKLLTIIILVIKKLNTKVFNTAFYFAKMQSNKQIKIYQYIFLLVLAVCILNILSTIRSVVFFLKKGLRPNFTAL